MYEVKDIPKIQSRKPDTHKGDYGKVFVLAGSLRHDWRRLSLQYCRLARGRRNRYAGYPGRTAWNSCIQADLCNDLPAAGNTVKIPFGTGASGNP